MKSLILTILISLLLTACGQNIFEESMKKGKDSIQSGNFEEAVKFLDSALIEKPSDKDALLLMDRAAKALDNKKLKEVLVKYQEENGSVYSQYMKLYLSINMKTSVSEEDITKANENIVDLIRSALDVGRKYNKYPDISDAHSKFVDALSNYRSALNEIKIHGTEHTIIAYSRMHEDAIQSYKDKIIALKEK